MNNQTSYETEPALIIEHFVNTAPGLKWDIKEGMASIYQKDDWKTVRFPIDNVREVLTRTDRDGKDFIQINFMDSSKILVTENLVGFKPFPVKNLDMTKIPKVVTSPDCLSVFEAIDDCLREDNIDFEELDTLKRVFTAIIKGAEIVGFDMSEEKSWLKRLVLTDTDCA